MKFRAGYIAVELDGMLEDDQVKEVFAHFGLAIHVGNVMEQSALNAQFTSDLLSKIREFESKEEWECAYDEFYARNSKLTFGQLVGRIKNSGRFSDKLNATLTHAKTVRNHLVHHFQFESAELMITRHGRSSMIEECSRAIQLFDIVDQDLERELAELRTSFGVSNDWLYQKYESTLKQWLEAAENCVE